MNEVEDIKEVKDIKNARYVTKDGTLVDVEVLTDEHGWIPFTCNMVVDQLSEIEREVKDLLESGEYDIAPYEADLEKETVLVRAERNKRLSEADKLIFIAEDNGEDTTSLRAYRQALRDIPQQDGFPLDVEWPEIPLNQTDV